MSLRVLAFSFILLLVAFCAVGAAHQSDDPPGGIRLLPGYMHQKEKGTDTKVGRIWKQNGLTMKYDIGKLAGNYAERKKKQGKYRWYKEQLLRSSLAQIVLTSDHTLYVSFTKAGANFYGRINSEEDLADMLLMLATYAPSEIGVATRGEQVTKKATYR